MSLLESVLSATARRAASATIVSQRHGASSGCGNIAYANGRSSMFSVLKTPWHGLGVVISEACGSQQALEFANLANWNLGKLQCYVDFQDAGGFIQKLETDRYAIVRHDNGTVLGTVGSRYEIVSNEECFDFLDSVIGDGGARYETAGALGNGEQVWLLAKFPDVADVVDGDTLEKYIMFATSHDGSMSVKCFPTTVRVVCQNTYRAALGRCSGGISMRHTANIQANIKAARKALGLASAACDAFTETARDLAARPLDNPVGYFNVLIDDVVDVTIAEQKVTQASLDSGDLLNAILAIDNVSERVKARERLEDCQSKRANVLDDILNRFETERCNGNPAIAGSAWAAVNAVSEFADHSALVRYKGSDQQRAESRMMSIIDGRAADLTRQAVSVALTMAS